MQGVGRRAQGARADHLAHLRDRQGAVAVRRPPLVHADAYRLGGDLEVDDLDLDASWRSR